MCLESCGAGIMIMRRKPSDFTITDQFCGAGGSSIGAVSAGARLVLGLNHWKLAIETHATNFPDADHDCTDISACDPRRYPSTDVLITSPECTTHSPAGGSRRSKPQRDMFRPHTDDPALIRSRATMFDVPRFTEYHRYEIVVVENVVEVLRWELFDDWLRMMHTLGYEHRVLSVNSMFAHPTPQSRDRIYIVFWRRGNAAPDLEFRPGARCPRCERDVEARQAWKNGRRTGKYRQQYVYVCPECATEVAPYYYAALNAIDLTIPGERIGDRRRPLKPRTLERVRYGLDRFGRMALLVRTNMTTDGGRVRTVLDPAHTQAASWLDAVVAPAAWVVETAYSHDPEHRTRGLGAPLMSQSTQQSAELVGLPFVVGAAHTGSDNGRVRASTDVLSTVHAGGGNHAMVIRPAAIVAQRNNNAPRSLAEPLPVVCTGGHHALVGPAALLNLRAWNGAPRVRELTEPLPAQVAAAQQDAIIARAPFLVTYMGQSEAHPIDGPMPTVMTRDREALVSADDELRVEDCYFRMLQPHEIGAAMAFPGSYVVLGNKRDRVKQFGNAVTPPVMRWIVERCRESLEAA